MCDERLLRDLLAAHLLDRGAVLMSSRDDLRRLHVDRQAKVAVSIETLGDVGHV